MATNPSMSGSRASRERSILVRLRELADGQGAFESQLFHAWDEKTQNTSGGTFDQGAMRTRDLTDAGTNEITGASLDSNQITLPIGIFWAFAWAPGFQLNRHKSQLYDTTGSAILITGTAEHCGSGDFTGNMSFLADRFTLTVESVIELQHWCQTTKSGDGFGVASNFSGHVEIYSQIMIWKVG